MTAHWTVDEHGTLWFEPRPSEVLEPWEALPSTYVAQIAQSHFDAAYDALVADVRAARLVDDMAAVIRRLDGGWHVLYRHDGDLAWQKGSHIQEPMSSGEVAALHHARRQGVQPDAYSTEGRRAAQDRHVDDFMRRAENARQQEET